MSDSETGSAGGYDEYAFVADLYDWVVPYRERGDVAFFVEAAKNAARLDAGSGMRHGSRADISRSRWR